MANLESNRVSIAQGVSYAKKSDLRSTGKVCWADLVDDQTTDPGDSPRSVSSSCQDRCENQVSCGRTLWADMGDFDFESVDEILTATDESAVAPSLTSPQVPHPVGTIVRERSTTPDEIDARVDRSRGSESVARVPMLVRADIDKREVPGQRPVGCRGKGWANNSRKGAGKIGREGSGRRATNKGAGKGGNKGAGKGDFNEKYQCQFILGIEDDSKFRVVRRVIGAGGANMKNISGESGAKLRLRGRGSGFLEGRDQKESDDDLMLCVSSLDAIGFETAKSAVSELIEDIYQHYRTFCLKTGHACPDLELKIHDGYRAGSW